MSVKVILYKSKIYSDGKHPVMIQVIVNRKTYRKSLFNIHAKYFDDHKGHVRSSHLLHVKYNTLIDSELQRIESRLLDAKIKCIIPDKAYIFNNVSVNVSHAFDAYIKRSAGKYAAMQKASNVKDKILSWCGDLPIKAIDNKWVDSFYNHLLTFNAPNTAAKNVSVLLTVLRPCEDVNMTVFSAGKKQVATTKNKLTKEELKAIESLQLSGLMALVRDSFMLSFYLRGMRISDVLTLCHDDISHGRLIKKSRKTDKVVDMVLVAPALDILNRYGHKYYCLPLLTMLPPVDENDMKYIQHIQAKTAICNKYLKIIANMAGIDKVMTTHVARHTFAYLADQSGMTAKRIQDLLDHSDLKTTQNYINDLNKKDVLDSAMEGFISEFRR